MADAYPVKPRGKNNNIIVAAPEAPGTSVNINVLPLPPLDRRRWPEKQRRV
jgi:hypothetical protein